MSALIVTCRTPSTAAGAACRASTRQVEVDHEQGLVELGRPGQHLPGRGDHDRVAVEDQVVLPADHVHVGQGAAGLRGPAGDQLAADVVLLAFVGRAVEHQQQFGPRRAGQRDRAALLPQVLADGDRDVDATHPHHSQVAPGHEDPELVEDAVVGQVVLGIAGHHLTAHQHRGAVLRLTLGHPDPDGRCHVVAVPVAVAVHPVEVAHHHRQVAQPVGGQVGGERLQGVPAGVDEGGAQSEVLDRVAGEHHLGEGGQVRAGVGGRASPPPDQRGVAGQVADGRVHLGQGQAQLSHAAEPRRRAAGSAAGSRSRRCWP